MLNADEMNGKSPFPEGSTCEQRTVVDAVIALNRSKPGVPVPIMEDARQLPGSIPESILHEILLRSKTPFGEVRGVLTFNFFLKRGTGFCAFSQTAGGFRDVLRSRTAVSRPNRLYLSFYGCT
jgi:hypothetical protein